MSEKQVKALMSLGGGPRSLNWKDDRHRSPKALGDMSGVILSRVTSKNQVGVQEFDYDLLSKIFICHDVAWTCINLVSSTAALAKLKVRKRVGSEIEYLPEHPLQKVLDFPNTSMTQFDLIQAYVTHQMLYGTVTDLLLREEMVDVCPVCLSEGSDECLHKLYYFNNGPITQIMPVHPSNIQQIYVPSAQRKLFFYVPDLSNNRKFPIHPDNMFTDPYYNPDASWYGVSPTFLLKRWLDLDSAMTSQVSDFFENGAIPSLIVSLKPGSNFSYDEEPNVLVEKMKEAWMKKFSGNGDAKKSPAFVYGDIQVEKIQEKIDQNVGKSLYFEIQNRVCATYGVPPDLYEMGLRWSGQRAAAEQSERNFYNRTISKILSRFEKKINQLVVPSYKEKGLEVAWDLSELGMAQFLIDIKEARIERHWEKGLLTRSKTQTLLGYEPDQTELGDDYYRLTVMTDSNGGEATNQLDKNLRLNSENSTADDKVATVDNPK